MSYITRMSRQRKLALAGSVLTDFAGITASWILVKGVATGHWLPALRLGIGSDLVISFCAVLMLAVTRLYSVQSRYITFRDTAALGLVAIGCGLISQTQIAPGLQKASNTNLLLPAMLTVAAGCYLVGTRLASRYLNSVKAAKISAASGRAIAASRTLLVGAGDAAELIVREMQRMPSPSQILLAAVDDDPRKSCTRMWGVPVLGTTKEIPELVARLDIDEILIAIPSARSERMREIVGQCRQTGKKIRTLPCLADLIQGKGVINQLREIDVTDLLRRNPVQTDLKRVTGLIEGATVMITGGGGSIGSELARQISRVGPRKLILVGKGENSLYEIQQQLLMEGYTNIEAVVADVRDAQRMESIFETHLPDCVFHAAAHKHVPLMESCPIEAIRNNVFGTLVLVELAVRYGTKRLTYVSTDKAVKPGNVMGATKRLSEMIASSRSKGSSLSVSIVRFGNVLGSRGSLIPAVEAQIKRGGPVRVTDPQMTRFFMTIPEAVTLILEATALGSNGETFILDMGKPVRIMDLVEDVIRLHGHEPNVSMPIVFTGARPGEKIHEELTNDFEVLRPTGHPKIRTTGTDGQITWGALSTRLAKLKTICDQGRAEEARKYLLELSNAVPDEIVVKALIEDRGVSQADAATHTETR